MERIHTLYARLLILFILLLLPLEICFHVVYNWCYRALREQLVDHASTNLVYIREELEENVQLIMRQMEYLLQNRAITRLYYYQEPVNISNYYMMMRDTQNILQLTRGSNPFMQNVTIYYVRQQNRVSSDGSLSIDVSTEEMNAVLDAFFQQGMLLVERGNRLSVGYAHQVTPDLLRRDQVYYYADSALRADRIIELLSSFDLKGDMYTFMVNQATGTIYHNALAEAKRLVPPQLPQLSDSEVHLSELKVGQADFVCLSSHSAYLNCTFHTLIPMERIFALPNKLRRFTGLYNVLLAIIVSTYCLAISRMVRRPIQDLKDAFRATRKGDFSTRLVGHYVQDFEVLASGFNRMVEKIQELIQSTYESRIRTQEAEYRQLQTQINPHFLYNSFFNLRNSIRDRDWDNAETMATYLGDYFRYITDPSREALPLSDEYHHALTYLRIQQMRFGDFMEADIAPIPKAYEGIEVPRLILQPIIENAIEHGVPTHQEIALVRLWFEAEQELLHVHFEDNGDCLTDDKLIELQRRLAGPCKVESVQHALVNTHRRLLIRYGAPCGLTVRRSELGGLWVTLTLRMTKDEPKGV